MTYLGGFVDDEDDVYAELLSRRADLKLKLVNVGEVTAVANDLIEMPANIVAIDYRLDESPRHLDPDKVYKGSALAQHLRDRAVEDPNVDLAIVLVSAEAKVKALFHPDKTAHDLFDAVYTKEVVNEDPDNIAAELAGLCKGYEKLAEFKGTYDSGQVFSLPAEELQYVDFQEIRSTLAAASAPHIVARLILRDVVMKAGILLDDADVSARLGVNLKDSDRIAAMLSEAGIRYEGVFSEPWRRWWSHRFDAWATGFFGTRPTGLTSNDRANVVRAAVGTPAEPITSTWTGLADELLAFACASCRRPTERRHSVAAFDARLPRFALRRRICWDCVQTDRYADGDSPLQIDDADRQLAERVRRADRPR